jgi:predicted amidohydrolase YtcJ
MHHLLCRFYEGFSLQILRAAFWPFSGALIGLKPTEGWNGAPVESRALCQKRTVLGHGACFLVRATLTNERAKTSHPWAQFLSTGVALAFGTDYPVEPITPFRGIYAAITRKNEAGNKEYFPDQKISIDDALTAYTSGSAYAEFAEDEKGTLTAGKLADFIVLDRDITKVDPAEILKTKVLRTVVGGKTVYSAK